MASSYRTPGARFGVRKLAAAVADGTEGRRQHDARERETTLDVAELNFETVSDYRVPVFIGAGEPEDLE